MKDIVTIPQEMNIVYPDEKCQKEHIALLLYRIYYSKHYMAAYADMRKNDRDALFQMWTLLGFFGKQAQDLFMKFEMMKEGNAFDDVRLNKALHSLYGNLALSIPDVDISQAEKINKELLKYIPNGDRQASMGKGLKIAGKGVITATAAAAGGYTKNPAIIQVAATSALSMFNDISQKTVIGNCLSEVGIDEKTIKNV